MKYLITDILLLGLCVASLTVFATIGITGRYMLAEEVAGWYWAEVSVLVFVLGWSIYSIVGKLK